MNYLQAKVSDRQSIKVIAYQLEPSIWESYSGKDKSFKRDIDEQRTSTLNRATKEYYDKPPTQKISTTQRNSTQLSN